jgi:hypothetical protein
MQLLQTRHVPPIILTHNHTYSAELSHCDRDHTIHIFSIWLAFFPCCCCNNYHRTVTWNNKHLLTHSYGSQKFKVSLLGIKIRMSIGPLSFGWPWGMTLFLLLLVSGDFWHLWTCGHITSMSGLIITSHYPLPSAISFGFPLGKDKYNWFLGSHRWSKIISSSQNPWLDHICKGHFSK